MKEPAKSIKTRSAKRNLFAELIEGFEALTAMRQGKRAVRIDPVKFKLITGSRTVKRSAKHR